MSFEMIFVAADRFCKNFVSSLRSNGTEITSKGVRKTILRNILWHRVCTILLPALVLKAKWIFLHFGNVLSILGRGEPYYPEFVRIVRTIYWILICWSAPSSERVICNKYPQVIFPPSFMAFIIMTNEFLHYNMVNCNRKAIFLVLFHYWSVYREILSTLDDKYEWDFVTHNWYLVINRP